MRHANKRYLKWFNLKNLLCVLTVLACLFGVFKIMPATSVSANDEKTVRVGYYEEEGFSTGSTDDAVKSGYAFDYLQRIKLLTNWKYEYVYGTYGELYEKLLKGEIDLLGGLAYRSEREAVISYPNDPMLVGQYLFYKLAANETITQEPESLNGKRIGSLTGAQIKVVEKFLNTNHLQAEIVEFEDMKYRDEALKNGSIDVMIAEGYNAFDNMGFEVFLEAGTADAYMVVNKQRPDILADLNRAQRKLYQENPDFNVELSRKWFRRTSFTTILSTEERKWLAEHDTLRVGYINDYPPYSYTDEDGKVNGVIKDVLPEIFAALKITDIKFEYKGYKTAADLKQALYDNEVDVVFPTLSNYWIAEKNGMVPSYSVINSNFNLLYTGEYPDMTKATIAVSRQHGVMNSFVTVHYPGNKKIRGDNVYDCVNAVLRGDADVTIVSAARTEYLLRSDERFKELNIAPLTRDVGLGFACLNANAAVMRILNHGLSLVDKDAAINYAYNYMPKHEMTLLDFLEKNIWLPVVILVVLFTLIMFFVIRENKHNREHLRETENQRQELSDKVEEISALNTELQDQQARLEEFTVEQEIQIKNTKALNEELQEQHRELVEAREEAERANNAKTTFLFNMTHDIRTPLNAIIGFTELEERNPGDEAKNKEYRQKVRVASNQLLDILNSVLEMARIENKKLVISEDLTDAVEMFNSCLTVFEGEIKKKNLHLSSSCDIQHPHLYMDKTHMSEVIMNIVSNAVKYTPDGGSVFAGVKELPGKTAEECYLEYTVRDTGIGMSEEFVKEIFEQFSRDRNSTQSGIQGTGLGMAIVKSILDRMGGTITVNSKLGEGTEIIFSIPYRIGELPTVSSDSSVQAETLDFTGKRILMAEDNDFNAEIAIAVLEDAGFVIERAVDGMECFDMLTKKEAGYYDLILMDIQMPKLDGYGATQRIRNMDDEAKANIPIVAMTANAFKEDQDKAFAMGMNAHLAKPIDIDKIFATLKEILK